MTDADVSHLPVNYRKPVPRHVLGAAITIPAEVSVSGYEQAEKTCKACGTIRVTVLGPDGGSRAWRKGPHAPQVETEPPCLSTGGLS